MEFLTNLRGTMRRAAQQHELFATGLAQRAANNLQLPENPSSLDVLDVLANTPEAQLNIVDDGTLGLILYNFVVGAIERLLCGKSLTDPIIDQVTED